MVNQPEMIKIKAAALVLALCFASGIKSQINTALLQQVLEQQLERNVIHLAYPAEVRKFYQLSEYHTAWIANPVASQQLLDYIDQATALGLRKEDYQFSFLLSFRSNKIRFINFTDSLAADFIFTDAAIHFFQDVAFGNQSPVIGYNGLNYSPGCLNISSLIQTALSENRFNAFLQEIECKSPEYKALKNQLMRFTKIASDTLYKKNIRIASSQLNNLNIPLIQGLHQLQIIDSVDWKIPDKELKAKLKEAQRLFSFIDDGVLRSTIIQELNTPLTTRIEELKLALNTIRWLGCIRAESQHIVVVNIPSATLLVYGNDKVILESKIIVGKKSTRTPTFISMITEAILYPYWMVPKKIATRELLPLIKRNIGYLEANSFQVVNEQGRVVDPYKINWQQLSVNYFPYTLRQSTGCDNSLGIVKLNFYNPYGVYLHDTPGKSLFSYNKRYFSHGCMRVEKALELAHLVLKNNTIAIDTLEEKGCLYNQKPIPVPASEKMPVLVLYNTAWIDSTATVRFYEDVYSKLPFKRN